MRRTGGRRLLTAAMACLATALPGQASPQTSGPMQAATPPPAPGMSRFFNRARTFHVDVPVDWRQLTPGDTLQLPGREALPSELAYVEPRLFYAVGAIDRWQRGEFDGQWLYVVEQANEWHLEADFAERLREQWRQKGLADRVDYKLDAIERTTVGPLANPVVTAIRTTTPATGGPATKSLDVYAAVGGRQLTLAFTSLAPAFDERLPTFRMMVGSLTFARPSRGEQTLGDRLWTPLVTGAVVGLVLVILYRWKRRAVPAPPAPR